MAWASLGAAAIGAAGSIGGALLNKQQAPQTAALQQINPAQVQQQAIQGNLASLPQANQLASGINSQDLMQQISNLNTALPGFSGLQQSLVGQSQGYASNPYSVPQAAIDQIMQQGAENNIGLGTGAGSQFSGNNALRSLGVNILQYGQQNFQNALGALSTLTGTAPNVSPVSPLSFLLSPQNTLSSLTGQAQNNQAIQQGAYNAQAAAANANSNNLFDTLTSQVPALGSALGSLISPTKTNATSAAAGGLF